MGAGHAENAPETTPIVLTASLFPQPGPSPPRGRTPFPWHPILRLEAPGELLNTPVPGPHRRAIISESLGWHPGIGILHLSPGHGARATLGGRVRPFPLSGTVINHSS